MIDRRYLSQDWASFPEGTVGNTLSESKPQDPYSECEWNDACYCESPVVCCGWEPHVGTYPYMPDGRG
jgi:hypothetical protein